MSPLKKSGDPGFTGAETPIDVRPHEDGVERDARLRRQTVEDGARIMDQTREHAVRGRSWAATAPRLEALRGMWRHAFQRGLGDLRARTRVLREHPVYQALPADRQAEWSQFLKGAAEAEVHGNFGPLWSALEQTASVQATNLVDWEPPVEAGGSPEELAAQVPR